MDQITAGLIVGVGLAILGATAALLKWAVRTGIEQSVNGQLTAVDLKVDGVVASMNALHVRFDSHEQRHTYEQRQLVAALDRQDFQVPDGWGS